MQTVISKLVAFLVAVVLLQAGCGSKNSADMDSAVGDSGAMETAASDTAVDAAGDGGGGLEVVPRDVEIAETAEPPWELPFEVVRPDVGEPMSGEEVAAFTRKITGFYKDSRFFEWVWWTSHGLHSSYDPSMHDYKLYWQDTQAIKEGDTVRFVHQGGADNLMIRTSKILNNAGAAYLMTGDEKYGRIVEQYCRGMAALSMGMEFLSEDPVVKYLQARAIFTLDHEYEMEGGRKVSVEYGPAKNEKYDWNAHTIPNVENPYWGEIWLRTMRSKDDVPHMFRTVPLLMKVAEEGAHEYIRDGARLGLEYMEGFARDIVDSGYQIRTKDAQGNSFVPLKEDGTVNDLASFVLFEGLIPGAECSAKLAAALISHGEPLDNDCGEWDHNLYEDLAVEGHFFNLAIIRYFHLAAVTNALANEQYETGETLLKGVVKRADRYMSEQGPLTEHGDWYADLAGWLLAAAAGGLPLTSAEARLVAQEYALSADHYAAFGYWDPWDASVPEGNFDYKPGSSGPTDPADPESPMRKNLRLPEISYVMEYCFSPYRNPQGAKLLDCEIVADPSRWGE